MILHYLKLEWKQYFRAANWQKSVFLNILLIFFALYLVISFLVIGIGGYYIIKKQFPNQDPLILVNSFLIYIFIGDLIFRFIMQKLPVMNIKPLLILPIKKNTIVHFILAKSSVSFFNIMGLFFYAPFAIILIKEGYDTTGVLGWLASMILIIQSTNFLNFLINKNNTIFIGLLILLIGGYLIQRFQLFDIPGIVGSGFDAIYQNPIYALIFLVLCIFLYQINYMQLRNQIYLDHYLKLVVSPNKFLYLKYLLL